MANLAEKLDERTLGVLNDARDLALHDSDGGVGGT